MAWIGWIGSILRRLPTECRLSPWQSVKSCLELLRSLDRSIAAAGCLANQQYVKAYLPLDFEMTKMLKLAYRQFQELHLTEIMLAL